METHKLNLFDFGPLHDSRKEIDQTLRNLPLQTGDILYRASNAKGPLGLPFSRLVGVITKSAYSHAAIVLMDENEPLVLEVNDQGTLKLRLIDWLDTCYTNQFSVFRLKKIDDELKSKIENEIQKIFHDDPDYDFTFSDPNKFYCTEAVSYIYSKVGTPLVEPETIKEVAKPYAYWILKIGSWLFSIFSDTALNFNQKMYYVGNSKKGMMSSSKTYEVYRHN